MHMRKEDYISIAIRVFGVVLLALAAAALCEAAFTGVAMGAWGYWPHIMDGTTPSPGLRMAAAMWGERVIESASRIVLFGCAGMHFIRGGKRITECIAQDKTWE